MYERSSLVLYKRTGAVLGQWFTAIPGIAPWRWPKELVPVCRYQMDVIADHISIIHVAGRPFRTLQEGLKISGRVRLTNIPDFLLLTEILKVTTLGDENIRKVRIQWWSRHGW
jgi:hypothetical protein